MNNTRKNNLPSANICGSKIQYYRTKNNLTYEQLSAQLHILGLQISFQSLYKIEVGLRTVVDYELCALAKIFKIPVTDLVSEYYDSLD